MKEARITIVRSTREIPPTLGLGIVDVTSERVGLTSRGVAYWEPIFRALGLNFDRIMTFEQFVQGVQRHAVTDCSIIPHVEAMAPGHAKGFLCASYDAHSGAMRTGLLRALAEHKARRVAFITETAVGPMKGHDSAGDDIFGECDLAELFSEEALEPQEAPSPREARKAMRNEEFKEAK